MNADGGPLDYTIERASASDLPATTAVQRRAFTRVARWIGLPDERMGEFPPIAEQVEEVAALVAAGAVVLKATDRAGRIVGTVRGTPAPDGSVEIGRLAVDDGLEGRGIGRALMLAIETAFPDTARFTLFTGRDAEGPLRLYRRLGYRVYEERITDSGIALVWLEKHANR
jgi:ribosomal protein S18 acetylase RimI-like enzyme